MTATPTSTSHQYRGRHGTRNGVEPDDAIRCMVDRAEELAAVHSWDSASKLAAKDALQAAVDAALDAGVSWQAIGTALDLRRGAAYQRFRHRLRIEVSRNPDDTPPL
jgi:hypothetical protein